MKKLTTRKKIWLTILGYSFLVLGVLGLFLPFLQGILFLLIGLAILSKTTPWAHRLLEKFRAKHPKLAKQSDKLMIKLKLIANK
ncbi:PGPGW domain-containing protein [Risungbinella massiliensis]|uniref:PGPGW domain-containing protein n=1 Tax=Risungbinella massiliensis TaxID=1329796 RepID=UPI0005CC8AAA|nr:PGPGW domain-containing protein [Risungbinella massiliensis]